MSASTENVITLAQRVASVIPPVPGTLRNDVIAVRAWENLMLEAGHGLAAALDHDVESLRSAIGPDIEVGTNPSWRALLQVALIVSSPREEAPWNSPGRLAAVPS